jgi:very-short-patch-repair endonuclease
MNGKAARARELRRESSYPERVCWELLRANRIGAKFRRQYAIGPYFADFACVQRKLVIEIDGEQHAYRREADALRTAFIASKGWRVVRFWANDVVADRDSIWAAIQAELTRGA